MNRRFRVLAVILGGVAVLLLIVVLSRFRGTERSSPEGAKLWTCSMHPQIRLDHPGRCPICGMDLVPVGATAKKALAHAGSHLVLSEHAREMARVETVEIRPQALFKEIRTVGKVEFDETNVAQITARIAGRVDEVFANFPGTLVEQGEHLVSIYSPDLFATQNEFLTAYQREQDQRARSRGDVGESLAASARRRLELWGITDEQIDELIRTGQPHTHLVIYAPRGGTVVEKKIRAGQYVNVGDELYLIADLTHVWLILEIYESELSWVRFGQAVQVTLESDPAKTFTGTVGFIEPILNDATRTVQVRVILKNESGHFKPGMYAQALLRVAIMPDGSPAPTGIEGKYACPMHPYVVSDAPGACTVCQMPLELVPGAPLIATPDHPPRVLAVPVTAVLNTGRRQLVYVEQQPGEYHRFEPKLGPRAGDFYPVLGGLEAGQRVVTRGNFLLDSQFQIAGNPSLLYPEGIGGGGTGHAGHAVQPAKQGEHMGHEAH